MQAREVLAAKSLRGEKRDGERVAERERGGGARRRRAVVGHASSRTLASSETSPWRARDESTAPVIAIDWYSEPLEMLHQRRELVRLAALGDQDRDVGRPDEPEVAMHRLGRMQEARGRAGGA